MLDWFKSFRAPAPAEATDDSASLKYATAELMAIAAYQDDTYTTDEKEMIVSLLQRRFDMSEEDATKLAVETADAASDTTDLYAVIRTIRDALPPEERVRIIEMLWETVYADGELDDYEANLMRRVAGLLYVDDRQSGEAKKRVLDRLGTTPHGG
jgi:uncharacterized tellurite resistance protein B-like protein